MLLPVPLPRQHGPGQGILIASVHCRHKRQHFIQRRDSRGALQQLDGGAINVSESIHLHAVGEYAEHKVLWKMLRCRTPQYALPSCLQSAQIENAQMRNLLLKRQLKQWPTSRLSKR